jgi:nitrite reductase (NADH) large subunit
MVYGLVAPLWEMCRALADGLVEKPSGYRGSVTSTKLKVSGSTSSRRAISPAATAPRTSCCATPARGVYKRVVVKDDRIVGAVLYGDTGDGGWYFDLLKRAGGCRRTPRPADLRPGLRLGRGAADPKAAVAALSDDAEICGCNGVSKGKVVACIAGARAASTRCAPAARLRPLRLVHRAGREPARADAWATIMPASEDDVQMHQLRP